MAASRNESRVALMTPERHKQICDLLYQVLEVEPDRRDAFLDKACGSDHDLRDEVVALLAADEEVRTSFLLASTERLLAPGSHVGDYEIESLLDTGGMGNIYRARDLHLPREVAIKVISSYLPLTDTQVRRFEQEAHAVAAINHPNILTIFGVGKHEGAPYLVTELLEGETLRRKLRQGRIPLGQATELAIQVARGLAAAHEKGIVHRDLKPENLFLTRHGQMKILDFGLAKLTHSLGPAPNGKDYLPGSILRTEPGIVMGTRGYMSPEQARGQPTDARSDIFSFGAVLYEMITGKHAFQRETSADSISSILSHQPPPVTKTVRNVPGGLQRVVSRCLEMEPELRYQDASELLTALETLPRISPVSFAHVAILGMVLILLFVGYSYGSNAARWIRHLFVVQPPRNDRENLVEKNLTANPDDDPVRAAAVTRDGKYVAYIDNSDKVNLLHVDSGDVRPLSLDSSYVPADWFSDGLHLLVFQRGGKPGIWKFSTWDSSLQKIFDGGALIAPVISPDGSAIAFVPAEHANEVWSMGAQGEAPHKVLSLDPKDVVENIAWSPDGRRLAFMRLRGTYDNHESAIETCDLAGGNRSIVLSDPRLLGREGVMAGMAWLPDGRIVYGFSTGLDEYNLWSIRVDPDGRAAAGSVQAITQWQDFMPANFQFTPDGKHMIAVKEHIDSSVYLGALPDKGHAFTPTRLTQDNWRNLGTAWSPDNKAILLYSQRTGNYQIRKQSLDGSTAETLVYGSGNYRDPIVSSTGTVFYSAYSSKDGAVDPASWRLMSTPLAGGSKTVVLNGRYSYGCAAAPSSLCLVSALQSGRQLIFSRLDPAKGKEEELARVDNPDINGVRETWRLSPDGSKVAILSRLSDVSIHILNVKDGKLSAWPIASSLQVYDLGWAADGKRLFLSTLIGSKIVIASIDSDGKVTTLYKPTSERTIFYFPIASTDGHSLAFTQTSSISNLVTLEHF